MAEAAVKGKFWGVWNRLPIPDQHPEYTAIWLNKPEEQLSDAHLLKKTIQRLAFLWVTGQRRHWLDAIPVSTKRVLWVHITDNIGDSLMRLASIQLLAKHCQVDLYVSPPAAILFSDGGHFNHVYQIDADAAQVRQQHYDLVILDAVQTKPLKHKLAVARATPFVTLHDLFHFCRDDYNLAYYCWWRMQYLLRGFGNDNSEISLAIDIPATARVKAAAANIPVGSIAVSVGGREAYRIYHQWSEVLHYILQQRPQQHFVLVGSANGNEAAEAIKAALPDAAITDMVAKCSLAETAAVLQRCRLLLCADGGLLHVASAAGAKAIALFAQEERPELRYVEKDYYKVLIAKDEVSQIDAAKIAALAIDSLSELDE